MIYLTTIDLLFIQKTFCFQGIEVLWVFHFLYLEVSIINYVYNLFFFSFFFFYIKLKIVQQFSQSIRQLDVISNRQNLFQIVFGLHIRGSTGSLSSLSGRLSPSCAQNHQQAQSMLEALLDTRMRI